MSSLQLREMVTAELHCHTVYSMDSSNRVDVLIRAARERGIQRLAITDHNTIEGAQRAKELAPDLVVVGEEVLTERGELIAYYVKEEVSKGLSVNETLRRLKAQGAFISIPLTCGGTDGRWRNCSICCRKWTRWKYSIRAACEKCRTTKCSRSRANTES